MRGSLMPGTANGLAGRDDSPIAWRWTHPFGAPHRARRAVARQCLARSNRRVLIMTALTAK
ncbi:hypothetical protein A11A3_05681 [Alcanivorax hongdengensis A-11-3]|uniref:Uncharacterized protein n=1 Tax=Alcanivorax hongdengensis A-11-3 TaxID=1177179 RepID=L0WDY7_9GAMM|nr:hypothetical protein A11A3_05681 [Alcanivorax hongdengensis A-11-3]